MAAKFLSGIDKSPEIGQIIILARFQRRYIYVIPTKSQVCSLVDRGRHGRQYGFIADRGFASCNVFAHAIENGFYFVIREKDINAKRLLSFSCLPDRIDQWADIILSRSKARKKMLHPHLYRCICKEVPFDFITQDCPEYLMRLRVVRFQISEGIFENIVTNLPDEDFSLECV